MAKGRILFERAIYYSSYGICCKNQTCFMYLPWLHLHSNPSKVSIHFWVTGSQVWWLLRHSFSGGHFMKFHEVWRTCPADLNLCNFLKLPRIKRKSVKIFFLSLSFCLKKWIKCPLLTQNFLSANADGNRNIFQYS